jgi:uncharacterized OB-fold protein
MMISLVVLLAIVAVVVIFYYRGKSARNRKNERKSANREGPTTGSFCPNCGFAISPNANFCGRCGQKLK